MEGGEGKSDGRSTYSANEWEDRVWEVNQLVLAEDIGLEGEVE